MITDPLTPGASVDEGIHAMLHAGKEKTLDCLEEWENCVRRHPAKAVLGAVAAGCLLHRLPIRSLIVANVKVIAALAPPALLAYGAAKLCEVLQRKGAEEKLPIRPLDSPEI